LIRLNIPQLDPSQGTFSHDLWQRFLHRYGKSRATKLVKALSKPVRNYALRVTTTKVSREEIIEKFENNGWRAQPHDILNEMISVKTVGQNSVPYLNFAPRIVMDKFASESVFVGSDLFGVGIRRMPKFYEEDIVSLVSPKDQIIATGVAKISSKKPREKGIAVVNTHSFYNVPSIRNLGMLDSGEVFSQSLPASYVAHVLDPQKGEKIIDLCAAPGGKSTGAAILSNDQAEIIAFDRSIKRLNKMSTAIHNQGLKSIKTIHANSIEYAKNNTIKADKVIVDPSCSAGGVRPKIYDETLDGDILHAANYQKSFLFTAAKIVRKGGVITYSTCTLEPEENEKVVAYAVNKLKLRLVSPDLLLGTHGEDTGDGLELEYMRRFYPDEFDTPGFFVAKFVK